MPVLVLVLTLARISGRDWKYLRRGQFNKRQGKDASGADSSRSPKNASFSCEESLVNTIA